MWDQGHRWTSCQPRAVTMLATWIFHYTYTIEVWPGVWCEKTWHEAACDSERSWLWCCPGPAATLAPSTDPCFWSGAVHCWWSVVTPHHYTHTLVTSAPSSSLLVVLPPPPSSNDDISNVDHTFCGGGHPAVFHSALVI